MTTESSLHLKRSLYTVDEFHQNYPKDAVRRRTCTETVKEQLTPKNVAKVAYNAVPVIETIRAYKWRNYIVSDILAGLTVGIMHIPQGMGFGILSQLTPVYGLYASFFPVAFYFIFGTSPHVAFGTNAVICLLIAQIVTKENATEIVINENNDSLWGLNGTEYLETVDELAVQYKAALAAGAAFIAGLILLMMGICRLGFITMYMSDSFISGFTTGAAFHIATSQVPKLLQITTTLHRGAGKIILTYIDIFTNITDTNIASFIIGVICIVILMLVKECINDRFKEKMFMPVPIDLIVVVIATLISYFGKFEEMWEVKPVGDIPSGIPKPIVPPLDKAGSFGIDSFIIAILIFAMTISMAKLCAKKHCYDVDANQELIAYGLGNLLSCWFWSMPAATAPPRTMLASTMGARTTFSGFFTALLLLLVLLFIGPLFSALPVSVLAAMIIVAMKGLFMQVLDLKLYWRVNKMDLIIWLATTLSVILIDIDIGLLIGIVVAAITVIIQSQFAKGYSLAKSEDEDVFLPFLHHKGVSEIPGIKIFRLEASLYYATAELFRRKLYAAVGHPRTINAEVKIDDLGKEQIIHLASNDASTAIGATNSDTTAPLIKSLEAECSSRIKYIIIDCSYMNYIDIAGVRMLQQMVNEYAVVSIELLLSGCCKAMVKSLDGFGFFQKFPKHHVYLGIEDALAREESRVLEEYEKSKESKI